MSDYVARNEHAWRLEKATGSDTRVVPTRQGWQGYSDHHTLANGLTVGRGCFQHQGANAEASTPFSCHLGLHIVLDAAYIPYTAPGWGRP